MNILVVGASSFVGSQIVTDLLAAGHVVTCAVRNTGYTKSLFPQTHVIRCDFVKDTAVECWLERLENIEVVINIVGILYHPNKKITWAIHYETPRALFDACVKTGVKKIIQISALGVDRSHVEYGKSKKAAEEHLLNLLIPSIILRSSLIYGRGAHGGTSLFRGLAGLPWVIPIPGKGEQKFQPIHLEDLSRAILILIETPIQKTIILSAVGQQRINFKELLLCLRSWLGFGKAKLLRIPMWIIYLCSFFGNIIPYSVVNSTSNKMLLQNNVASDEEMKKFQDHIDFIPRDFISGLFSHPSTVQDRWHSKLYFLKPLLKFSIAFVWIFTAICSVFFYPKSASYSLLAQVGVSNFWKPILLYGASALDAFFGFATLFNYKIKMIGLLQLLTLMIYTTIITWRIPQLWLEPFAPIAKNIPFFVAIMVYLAIESDR